MPASILARTAEMPTEVLRLFSNPLYRIDAVRKYAQTRPLQIVRGVAGCHAFLAKYWLSTSAQVVDKS
jgi:hypothetical protein